MAGIRVNCFPTRTPVMSAELPRISVVVIGRNEGQRLVRCLRSVLSADYPQDKLELIYVDSGSTDTSVAAARELGAQVSVISRRRPCAAAGRNAGWRQARHQLVQFLDGDTILNESWLKEAGRAMADPTVACVFGRVEELAPTATIYNLWAHHDWYVPPGPVDTCGGIALFRLGALQQVNGFDETLIAGEEPEICFRIRHNLGLTVLCLNVPMALHDVNMRSFGEYWRRCYRTGHAYAEIAHRHREFVRWRRREWRNIGHVLAVVIFVGLSMWMVSVWPLMIGIALLCVAIVRNAWRCRERVGTFPDALAYALHHCIAKVPIVAGQCDYWLRRLARRRPRSLIEYRSH